MGESLYGDPGLCIRELLQNALDALELRELRLKMKRKGEKTEPVDGELIDGKPGWIRENGEEVELKATLDWGTDEETGQQWLRVTDNGVGMTEERAAASPVGVPTTRLCRSNSRRMIEVSPRSTRSGFGWVLS